MGLFKKEKKKPPHSDTFAASRFHGRKKRVGMIGFDSLTGEEDRKEKVPTEQDEIPWNEVTTRKKEEEEKAF